jgi:hypothetical protein
MFLRYFEAIRCQNNKRNFNKLNFVCKLRPKRINKIGLRSAPRTGCMRRLSRHFTMKQVTWIQSYDRELQRHNCKELESDIGFVNYLLVAKINGE